MSADDWIDEHNAKLIRIQWDRIQRSNDCITVNGQPVEHVSGVKLEWPGTGKGLGGGAALLTVEQWIVPKSGAEGAPSQIEVSGYLVPCDLWEAYQRWLIEERRK